MRDDAALLRPDTVEEVQEALRAASLDGWLLAEFHGNNPVATRLLGLEHATRRSFTLVPAEGAPVALIHEIEASYWQEWPWNTRTYSGWRQMEKALAGLSGDGASLAMEISPGSAVPTLDLVPSGTVDLVRAAGVRPVSSGELVTRFHARWTHRQLEGHRRTAEILARTAREAFQRAADGLREGSPPTEGELSGWIRETLAERDVILGTDCIVAVGAQAAMPHYAPGASGEPLREDQVLLVDLWGRTGEDEVFADQTWMGFLGSEPPDRVSEVWAAVRDARDAVVTYLERCHAEGRQVRGLELDDVARNLLTDRGYGDRFVHRTGHSIDTDLHGSGPNLDNLETRDDRVLVSGVGFSVEPGVYLPGRLGIRSEINVHWGEEGPEVTPEEPQREMFLLRR